MSRDRPEKPTGEPMEELVSDRLELLSPLEVVTSVLYDADMPDMCLSEGEAESLADAILEALRIEGHVLMREDALLALLNALGLEVVEHERVEH